MEGWHRRSREFRKLNLSNRITHALVMKATHITNADELAAIALGYPERLLGVRGIGATGLAEIRAAAREYQAKNTRPPLAQYLQQFYADE